MTTSMIGVLLLGSIAWPGGLYAQPVSDPMGKAVKTDDMKWERLDDGFEISILYTNPKTQATYLVIRGPGNQHIARHWHSSNESITVLKGTFTVAHDGSAEQVQLSPGGFAYMPARMIHEAWTGDGGATYFITVDGKWDVTFVK